MDIEWEKQVTKLSVLFQSLDCINVIWKALCCYKSSVKMCVGILIDMYTVCIHIYGYIFI